MNSLENILQYQSIDIQRRRKINEIENSDYAKKAHKAKSEYDKARQVSQNTERDATPIVNYLNNVATYCDDAISNFDNLQKSLEKLDDLKAVEEGIEKLGSYKNKIVETERKLVSHRDNGKKIIERFINAQENGKVAKDVHNQNVQDLTQLKNTNKSILDDYDKQMKILRNSGDKNLFAIYDDLVCEKKLPAFVPLANSDTCSGCGLQMSQKTIASLKENNFTCRCDTCRRVVYRESDVSLKK
ncbi:MAG: hypothetical protein LBU60_05615 [Clostridiales bacterium]|jgi:predicted  nucleic acid-binding Zn-ribbon protein|nr:hypothetical protein [Clostridiales bacterium]